MLKFSDGINIDTSGNLRILTLHDGIYIVGQGYLIPVEDQEEATELLSRMKSDRKE